MNYVHLFAGIALTLMLIPGVAGKAVPDNSAQRPQQTSIPMEELKAFAETYWQIKQLYVDEVDDTQLLEGAINGMLKSLDPYSGYLNSQDLQELQSSADGVYDGLGVEVIADKDRIRIVKVLADSPAERAGIRPQDMILEVNSQRVSQLGVEQAIDAMRGKAGESIQLQLLPAGKDTPLELTLVRETLTVNSVQIRELSEGYWLIELSVFQRDTGYELARELRRKVADKTLSGVVLDLRDNPGGVLRAAVDVVDLMLAEGMIVYTQGRAADSRERYFANPGDELEQVPLVVLINQRSASASEIVAAALQDHHRALILGEKSYGKGVVQSILPIQHHAAIKLTTSRYFTPSGRNIDGVGVEPDIPVDADKREQGKDHVLDRALALLIEQQQSKL